MLTQNMRSLKNKIDGLELILQEQNFDAICLTETWIKPDQKDYIHVNNYYFATAYYREQRSGGGVTILLKEGTLCAEITEINNLSIDSIVECCALELKSNIIIITIYRANREIGIFFNFLDQLLQKLKYKNNKHIIIITGDFNIDKIQNSNNYQILINKMLEYNLHQRVDNPTRVTFTSSSCIDHIYTNMKNINVTVKDLGLSDHHGLISKFEIIGKNKYNTRFYKRIFNKNIPKRVITLKN